MLQCSLRFHTNKKFKFQVIKTNEYPNVEKERDMQMAWKILFIIIAQKL